MADATGAFTETRPPAAAGQFYPAVPGRLAATVEACLRTSQADRPPPGERVRALIAPHAGYAHSGGTAGRAYAWVCDGAEWRRALVLAPAHEGGFRGVAAAGYASFETPLGRVPVDADACRALLAASPRFLLHTVAHAREHSREVQLPFLQVVLPAFALVPLICGEVSRAELREAAEALRRTLWRDDTLWVVSADFTRYGRAFGYTPFQGDTAGDIERLDRGAIRLIEAGDTDGFLDYVARTGAPICGATPIALLLAALEAVTPPCTVRLLAYTTSGRLSHDPAHSVSYAAMAVTQARPAEGHAAGEDGLALTAGDRRLLLRLARASIEEHLQRRPPPWPEEAALSPGVRAAGAAFVSLHRGGDLRGCIGSLEPEGPLYRDVMANAVNAAFHDGRFHPVEAAELATLTIEISVLTRPRPVAGPEAFEVGRHGVLLEKGGRQAVFLPQVAPAQGWDRETTLSNLARKAGLRADDWRRGARLSIFTATVFSDRDPHAAG